MDAFVRFKKIIDHWPALIGVVYTSPMQKDRHFTFKCLTILFLLFAILFPIGFLYTIFWCDGELAMKALSVFGTSLKVCFEGREHIPKNNSLTYIQTTIL